MSVALSPNGRQLCFATAKGTLRVRDMAALEDGHAHRPNAAVWLTYSPIVYTSYAYSGQPSLVSLSPEGRVIALYTDSFEIQAENDGFGTLGALSTDGRVFAASFGDSNIVLVKPEAYDRTSLYRPSWNPVRRPRPSQVQGGRVTGLALDRNGELIAAGYALTDGGGALVVSRRRKNEDVSTQRFDGPLTAVSYSPQGKVLAAAVSKDGRGLISLWDSNATTRAADLQATRAPVRCAAFSSDERILATGLEDGTLTLWDVASHKAVLTVQAHHGATNSVAWSKDGKTVLTGGADGYIRFWKP